MTAVAKSTDPRQAWSRGGGLSQARQSAPSQPDGTKTMTTSSVIAWWRAVLVIACLAVAVIAPLVLNENRQSVERVNVATQQMLRLETVRSDLLGAEAAATQALLMATDGQAPDAGYLGLADSASAELIAAAAASPSDSLALQQINTALGHYLAQLSVAMKTGSQNDMRQASEVLVNDLLPLLDTQIAAHTAVLESQGDNQQWLIAVLAVPVLLLVVASVVVARRTRRVVNLGLMLGLAAAIASLVIVTQLVTTTAMSISAVQTSGVTQAAAVAKAHAAVTEAKAIEGRMLLGITDSASGAQAYADATGQASDALTELGSADATDRLSQMISTHDQLVAATDPPSPELVASAQEPYDWLVSWLADQSSTIGNEVDADLSGHAATVEAQAILVAGIMVIAAVSSVAGLSGSLRRYR
ncbi:hypothetical protein [Brooklawnia sp.]|uniref:hypothetical protein n=1 Tax=Brooklawnia sp. TaxID=2699740 RepID=UPI00311ECFEC